MLLNVLLTWSGSKKEIHQTLSISEMENEGYKHGNKGEERTRTQNKYSWAKLEKYLCEVEVKLHHIFRYYCTDLFWLIPAH